MLQAYHFFDVMSFEASTYSIDANRAFSDTCWARLLKELANIGSGFIFASRSHRVFEIVSDTVSSEASGFFEHLLR